MPDARVDLPSLNAGDNLVACHECDLVQRLHYPPRSRVVRCARCGGVLLRHDPNEISRTLALALASMIMFIVANAFPIVAIDMQGNTTASSLASAVRHLWLDRMYLVAILVAVTTIVAPAGILGMLVYVLGAVRLGLRPPAAPQVLRWLHLSRPWGMIEVFLLGVLVSVVKLTHYASVMPGLSLWALLLLIPMMAGMSASFHPDAIWRRLGSLR